MDERRRVGLIGRDHPVREELVRRYAYGIPTGEAIDATAAVSANGVVELGPGTGYWARLLHERHVDVLAYDGFRPSSDQNSFVDASTHWFPVRQGDEHAAAHHPTRTLLLVWPTWNEPLAAAAPANFCAAAARNWSTWVTGRRPVALGVGSYGVHRRA